MQGSYNVPTESMDENRKALSQEAQTVAFPAYPEDRRLRFVCYVTLIAVLIVFALIRIRLRSMPLERDEGEYAYAGQLMLEGIPPYKLALNMKLPGTYAAYAVIMGVFGQTVSGIRLGLLLVNAVTNLLVFLLGRRVFGTLAGTVAAATYSLLSNRTSMLALDGHATHFVALAAVAATLLLLHALDTEQTGTLFASGLLYGIGFLMKQPGLLSAIFGVVYWISCERRRGSGPRRLITQGSFLVAGIALPFVLTCLILLRAGVFDQFRFWIFSYGSQYGSIVSLATGWQLFRKILPWIVRPFVIWGLAAFGLTALLWNRRARANSLFLTGFLVFSFLAVCPGLYFRGHYFLVMLPAVGLLAGIGIAAAREKLLRHPRRLLPAWLPAAFFALTFLTALWGHRKFLLQMNPLEVSQAMHAGDGVAEAATVAAYIQQHCAKQDSIAVLGSEPEIYFYAHRHSATGFIYIYALMENQTFARSMQTEMIQQIEQAHPRIVVYVDDELSWGWSTPGAQKQALFAWMQGYLNAGYDLIETVPIAGNAQHQWGNQASFYIYQRREHQLLSAMPAAFAVQAGQR
jgi:hypothetical protein